MPARQSPQTIAMIPPTIGQMEARAGAPEQWLLQNRHERLWPAVQPADPVPRLEVRPALACLDLPVLPHAHAEAPRRLPHRPAGPASILLEQPFLHVRGREDDAAL